MKDKNQKTAHTVSTFELFEFFQELDARQTLRFGKIMGLPSSHLHPAERLKRLREALQLSQRELAKEFGVSSGAIASWELGTRPMPGPVLKLMDLYEAQTFTEETDSSEALSRLEVFRHLKKSASELGLHDLSSFEIYLKDSWNQNQITGKIKMTILDRLIGTLRKSKGVSLKIAQLASFLEIGLPVEVRSALGALQSSVSPISQRVIGKVIEEEYGKPLKNVFPHWNPQPLAVTSLGQVHWARLESGEEVAVKVQNPEISEILSKQFGKIEFIHALSSVLRRTDGEIIDEIKRAVQSECDYFLEARHQEKFRNIFSEDKRVIVPRVFHEYTRSKVLVTEFIRGESFQSFAARASQDQKNRAAEIMVEVLTRSVFSHCFIHGDLHPGNFLFADGKLVVLDFGRMVDFPPERMKIEIRFYLAVLNNDYERARELFKSLDFAKDPETFNFDEFWNFLMNSQAHLMANEKFQFTRDYVSRMTREGRRFSSKHQLRMTKESFWAFGFSASTWALYADLEAACNWRQIALDVFKSSLQ